MMYYGELINKLRKDIGITQKVLSDRIGCGPSTLEQWISQDYKNHPHSDTIPKIADALCLTGKIREDFVVVLENKTELVDEEDWANARVDSLDGRKTRNRIKQLDEEGFDVDTFLEILAQQYQPMENVENLKSDRNFVGRKREIAEIYNIIDDRLKSNERPIVIDLYGLQGIGKTQIALNVANRIKRQKKIDVLSFPHLSDEKIRDTILKNHFKQSATGNHHVDWNLYKSFMQEERLVLVLDDIYSYENISLLVESSYIVIITSRRKLDQCESYYIGPLAIDDSIEILKKQKPHWSDNYRKELAQISDGSPLLLLKIIALHNQPGMMSGVSKKLPKVQQKRRELVDEILKDLFNDSFELLEISKQDILRALSVMPSSFDVSAAETVLLGRDGNEVIKALKLPNKLNAPLDISNILETLFDYALLIRFMQKESLKEEDLYKGDLRSYQDKTRYNLEPLLIERLKREQIDTDDVYILKLRHADHFADILANVSHLFQLGGQNVVEGLTRFDYERIHVDTAWNWLLEQAPAPQIDKLLLRYADGTAYLAQMRYEPNERTRYLEKILERAYNYDRLEKIRLLTYMGNAYKQEGSIQKAIRQYEQVIKEIGANTPELAAAYIGLGNCFIIESKHNSAIGYFLTGARIAQRIGNRRIACIGYINLGDAYMKSSHNGLDWAVQYCEISLWMMNDVRDLRIFLRLLYVLSNLYRLQGRGEDAEHCNIIYQKWLGEIIKGKKRSISPQEHEREMLEVYNYKA